MNNKTVLLLSAIFILYSQSVSADTCQIIPECNTLGYTMKNTDCGDLPYVKCPFNPNAVLCIEDCSTYPLRSCNPDYGTCQKCSLGNAWKYSSCALGYGSDGNGNCIEVNCTQDYPYSTVNGTFDKERGREEDIISCKSGSYTYYGYLACNKGWTHTTDNKCEKNDCTGYQNIEETKREALCNIAKCEYCQTGKDVYVKFDCPSEYKRDGYDCVKNTKGSICYYRASTQNIQCGKDYICEEGETDCAPIGIVFYSDMVETKIIALTDINGSGKPVSAKMTWGTENTTTGCTNKISGRINTETAKSKGISVGVINASLAYAPDICKKGLKVKEGLSDDDIVEDNDTCDAACDGGCWYTAAIDELGDVLSVSGLDTILASMSETYGSTLLRTDANYWSSTEDSSTSSWVLLFYNGYRGAGGKYGSYYVRPVLAF